VTRSARPCRAGSASRVIPRGRQMSPSRMRTTAGDPSDAAPAGDLRPPTRARRGRHPPFSVSPLRPPWTRGASAQLTARTLTQADGTPPGGGRCRLRRAGWSTALGPRSGSAPAGDRSRHEAHAASARARRHVRRGGPYCQAPGLAALCWSPCCARPAYREPDPLASRCGQSSERTRPLAGGDGSERTGRGGAVRVWLAWVAGVRPRLRHRWCSRPWSSSARELRHDPLELLV
jgi:hypothetical protein